MCCVAVIVKKNLRQLAFKGRMLRFQGRVTGKRNMKKEKEIMS
jgi:hypothetical protein